MFAYNTTKNLKEGEEIKGIIRRYPLTMAGTIIIAAVLLLAPFFFLFPLLHWGQWGVLVFFISFILGIILAARMLILYWLNMLIITNVRIIDVDQRGLLHRVVSETTYEKIQDVSFSMRGLTQTILRCGTVQIQTAGNQANIEVTNVHDPASVQQMIIECQSAAKPSGSRPDSDEDELRETLRVAQRKLGAKTVRRILDEQEES